MAWRRSTRRMLLALTCLVTALSLPLAASEAQAAAPIVQRFLERVPVGDIVPGADAYGSSHEIVPAIRATQAGKTVGWVFLTSDIVATTGYSGKPIHVLVGVNLDAKITGVRLVEHSEPIVLIGIPDSKIKAVTEKYAGLDLVKEAAAEGTGHALDIISGATVTIMIIDDSIVRGGIKIARALGLGGLEAPTSTGPKRVLDLEAKPQAQDWQTLSGDGAVRNLALDLGQVNQAFEANGDQRAIERPEKGPDGDRFIDLHMALVSVPTIGLSLLGPAEFENLGSWLAEGEHAIAVMGRGPYSFKGSGYVRGGLFDRIQLIQGDNSIRFNDKQHLRIGRIAADGSPEFDEKDLFRIPADSGFVATEPFHLQLLVQRSVGAIEKVFLTFDLGYQTPARFVKTLTPPPQAAAAEAQTDGSQNLSHLWPRIWRDKLPSVIILGMALVILTTAFFFQMQLTKFEKATKLFRYGFLIFTLFWLGWYANAQLSVVNVLTLFNAVTSGFSWNAFLMDPLIFVLWFAVAAALLLWGRGAYCGWLCPFGALQELSNHIARFFRVPQITLPWGLHERLWSVKYLIFLGLFALSLYSIETAEHFAEVEPFKTAIILKFVREWPFVLFAVGLLIIGLFIERFYCRYLCPLGAALAIPARLRLFDWLKRYRECGNPCARCANECMVQAIDPLGRIEPNECQQCMHCQVLYQSKDKCPVCIKKEQRRNRFVNRGDSPSDTKSAQAASSARTIPIAKAD